MTALRYWREIGLGIAAMLLVIATALWRTTDAKLDQCNREAKVWAKANKTQEQSITTLMEALDRKEAETAARAAELAKQREDDANSRAQSDLKAATTQKRLDALNRIARDGTSVCGVSDELRAALRGL